MKFIVSSSALFNRLQTIGRVINSKNTLPILDCFLFEIQDNILTITASDSETTLITSLELVESGTGGDFFLEGKLSIMVYLHKIRNVCFIPPFRMETGGYCEFDPDKEFHI